MIIGNINILININSIDDVRVDSHVQISIAIRDAYAESKKVHACAYARDHDHDLRIKYTSIRTCNCAFGRRHKFCKRFI